MLLQGSNGQKFKRKKKAGAWRILRQTIFTDVVQKGALTTPGMKKVAKSLKFWSRKTTKRKKSRTTLLVAPAFPCDDYLHPRYSPSAPPLPPWVELDYECGHGFNHLPTFQMTPESVPCNDEAIVPILPRVHCASEGCCSYREYGYTVPVLHTGSVYGVVPGNSIEGGGNAIGERAGFFGCLVKVGMHMFGCLFPCLSIREAAGDRKCRAHYY